MSSPLARRITLLALILTLMPLAAFAAQNDDPYANLQSARIGNCKEYINLRDGPSTDTKIIDTLELDTHVLLMEWSMNKEWCKVLYDNDRRTGWVFGEFIVR